MREVRGAAERPCDCVFRAVFRACYNRFRELAARGVQTATVSLEEYHAPGGRPMYSRKREEYVADFYLVTRRELSDFEFKVFRYAFLLGADWTVCAPFFGMDRGTYFHFLYRIEEKLGRVYAELQPYALYPLDEYFGGHVRAKKVPVYARKLRGPRGPKLRLPMTA